jgi:hypothetical protein
MPDTVEHRVEMHQLAQERRAAGKPVWDRKISLAGIFHNPDLTFEQRRGAIVEVLRASTWLKEYDEGDDLPQFVDELAGTEDVDQFDAVFDAIYDVADADRVWIGTF